MTRTLTLTCILLTVGLLAAVAPAAIVNWNDGDGLSGTYTGATWDNLQAAITSAEGVAGTDNAGWVKVSGDLTRTGTDTSGDLAVATGNLAISGGWNDTFTGLTGGRSTLDVDGTFRVLAITGADTTVDNLKITGGSSAASGAGIYTTATGTRITNCEITGNTQRWGYGAGIYMSGADSRISSCEITNNVMQAHSSHQGVGIYVTGGSIDTPQLIENCKITGNTMTSSGGAAGGGIYSDSSCLVVANCEITENTARDRSAAALTGGGGICINAYSGRVLVFGSLIAQNGNASTSAMDGAGVKIYAMRSDNVVRFANCTIADNVDSADPDNQGVVNFGQGSLGYGGSAAYVNSILAENRGVRVRNNEDVANQHGEAYFQRSTIFEPDYDDDPLTPLEVYYQVETGARPDQFDDNLTDALGFTESRFYSVDDSGGAHQDAVQNELFTDPSFVGSGDDPYELAEATTNSMNNGLTQTGTHADITGGSSDFVYVDTDLDGAYDPAWDVIVDLMDGSVSLTPSAMHLVYETDMRGHNRYADGEIDRGAYEVPEPATMALLSLGFVGLIVRRRRGRRK